MEVNPVEPMDDPLKGLQGNIGIVKLDGDRLLGLFDPVALTEDKGAEVSRTEENEAVEVKGLAKGLDGDVGELLVAEREQHIVG